MANPEHLAILKQGVEVWNRWREENSDVQPNLIEANLSKTNLGLVNLNRTDLKGANFNQANLYRASFRNANLSLANFSLASLKWVNFGEASLLGANLSGSDLIGANFSGANLFGVDLREANLSGARMGGTALGNVDLSRSKGLTKVTHLGPSTIGFDVLYRSNGKIPDAFLRGCGLSDWQILNAKLYRSNLTSEEITSITYKICEILIDNPVRYYSCFISYSTHDQGFAEQLYSDLQHKGVRCWFAPKDMKIGTKIRSTIDQSIQIHDKLLLILSENSLNSVWVESEVEKAFEEERQRNQTVLFPVRLDEAVMETDHPWAAEIRRTRHIGDFTQWKDHDKYQQAFECLLRDLKMEG